jgi:ABC-type hemin transport system substrate-binding protein
LVPSLTETLVVLGLADRLVARTGYCIHPAADVARIAKVGGTKTVNLAKLRRLRPTHVVVNVDENRLETVEAIRAWGADAPEVVVTHPLGPEDNPALLEQLAATFALQPGVAERATALAATLRAELARTEAGGRTARRVLYLIWHDPWMTVARDTYLSRMLGRIGWQTLPDLRGGTVGAGRYPALRGDEAFLREVDLVLLSSEPFAFTAMHRQAALDLCPAARVLHVDGELLSWYGARAVEGLRYLRRIADDNAGPLVRP